MSQIQSASSDPITVVQRVDGGGFTYHVVDTRTGKQIGDYFLNEKNANDAANRQLAAANPDLYVPTQPCADCGCAMPCNNVQIVCDWCARVECDVCGCTMSPTYYAWERCEHCFNQCMLDDLANRSTCRICGCTMPRVHVTVCDACQIHTEVRYATPRCFHCRTAAVAASGTLCETCAAEERATRERGMAMAEQRHAERYPRPARIASDVA